MQFSDHVIDSMQRKHRKYHRVGTILSMEILGQCPGRPDHAGATGSQASVTKSISLSSREKPGNEAN